MNYERAGLWGGRQQAGGSGRWLSGSWAAASRCQRQAGLGAAAPALPVPSPRPVRAPRALPNAAALLACSPALPAATAAQRLSAIQAVHAAAAGRQRQHPWQHAPSPSRSHSLNDFLQYALTSWLVLSLPIVPICASAGQKHWRRPRRQRRRQRAAAGGGLGGSGQRAHQPLPTTIPCHSAGVFQVAEAGNSTTLRGPGGRRLLRTLAALAGSAIGCSACPQRPGTRAMAHCRPAVLLASAPPAGRGAARRAALPCLSSVSALCSCSRTLDNALSWHRATRAAAYVAPQHHTALPHTGPEAPPRPPHTPSSPQQPCQQPCLLGAQQPCSRCWRAPPAPQQRAAPPAPCRRRRSTSRHPAAACALCWRRRRPQWAPSTTTATCAGAAGPGA